MVVRVILELVDEVEMNCLHLRSIARDSAGDDSIGLGVGAVQLLGVTAPGMSWTR